MHPMPHFCLLARKSLDLIHRKDGQLMIFCRRQILRGSSKIYFTTIRRLFYSRKSAHVVVLFVSLEEDREAKEKKTCKKYTGCARENTTTESILGSNPHLTFVFDENIAEFQLFYSGNVSSYFSNYFKKYEALEIKL